MDNTTEPSVPEHAVLRQKYEESLKAGDPDRTFAEVWTRFKFSAAQQDDGSFIDCYGGSVPVQMNLNGTWSLFSHEMKELQDTSVWEVTDSAQPFVDDERRTWRLKRYEVTWADPSAQSIGDIEGCSSDQTPVAMVRAHYESAAQLQLGTSNDPGNRPSFLMCEVLPLNAQAAKRFGTSTAPAEVVLLAPGRGSFLNNPTSADEPSVQCRWVGFGCARVERPNRNLTAQSSHNLRACSVTTGHTNSEGVMFVDFSGYVNMAIKASFDKVDIFGRTVHALRPPPPRFNSSGRS